MKTKIISIILAVAIAVTGFTVKSSASMPKIVGDLLRAIGIATAGSIAGSAAWAMGEDIADVASEATTTYIRDVLPGEIIGTASSALNMDAVCCVYNASMNTYYFEVSSEATGDEAEFANILVNKLNNADPNILIRGLGSDTSNPLGNGMNKGSYEILKNAVGQAITEFTYKKGQEYAVANGVALENNGAVPVYDFNFVGPIPSIDMPEHYTMVKEYMLDGFTFTKPTTKEKINSEYVTTHGFDGWGVLTDTGYKYSGIYILYDEEIYFGTVCSEADSNGKMIAPTNGILSGVTQFVRSDGATLHDVTGLTSVPSDIPMGIYLSNRSDLSWDSYPSLSAPTKINNNSFTVTSDGTTIEVPRTDKEQAIADGIDLGLVDEDGNIILDENGNIVSIDGLNIDKLMQLIQQIADNGSISFDSVEEYLAEISRLLCLANVDSAAMNTVISNLKELEKAQSKDISDINANVAAIAEALAAAKEANLEFETPDVSIFDKFPFSLPWDFYNVISLLCTEEKAPVFTVPIETNLQFGSLDYEVDEEIVLDLTVFKLNGYDVVQIFTSTTSYLFFIICLIGATKKLLWK